MSLRNRKKRFTGVGSIKSYLPGAPKRLGILILPKIFSCLLSYVLSWPLHAISSNEYILDLSKIYIKCKGLLRFSPEILHFWHSALASFQEVVLMQFKHAIIHGLRTPGEEITFHCTTKNPIPIPNF